MSAPTRTSKSAKSLSYFKAAGCQTHPAAFFMRDQIRQEYGNIKARDLGTVLTQLSSTFVRHLPVKQQSAAL